MTKRKTLEEKQLFAANLKRALDASDLSASEAARRAEKYMLNGAPFGADTLSGYLAAKNFPNPPKMRALCRALGITEGELFPTSKPEPQPEPLDGSLYVRDLGDGKAWLSVNQEVSWSSAMAIIKELKGS